MINIDLMKPLRQKYKLTGMQTAERRVVTAALTHTSLLLSKKEYEPQGRGWLGSCPLAKHHPTNCFSET